MSENLNLSTSNNPNQSKQTEDNKPATNSARLTLLFIVVAIGVMIYRAPGTAYAVGAFLITLGILVFVHEWGHYQFARWAGMKVNRFGIGFPPWLFTVRRNNIDYSLGALPIGGMVDIAGLGSEEEMVAAAKGAEFTTLPSRPDVPRGEKQFQDASLGWRFWTLFAGPLMNFLFAIIVFIGVYSFAGVPVPTATSTVRTVMPNSPAQAAGILAGDRIIAVNNKPTTDTKVISDTITASKDKPVTVTLERGGQVIQKTLRPIYDDRPTADGKGTVRVLQIGVGFRLIV
jgi:regulator of sigma E protease